MYSTSITSILLNFRAAGKVTRKPSCRRSDLEIWYTRQTGLGAPTNWLRRSSGSAVGEGRLSLWNKAQRVGAYIPIS